MSSSFALDLIRQERRPAAASLIASVARTLGFGQLEAFGDCTGQDYFVESPSGKVYVLHQRLGRFTQLQRIHGTGRVSYSPHPLLAVTAGPERLPKKPELLLLITGDLYPRTVLYKLLHHLKKIYSEVIHIEAISQLNLATHLQLFYRAGLVIIYGVGHDPQLSWLALGSGTPFCTIGPRPAELVRALEGLDYTGADGIDDYYLLKDKLERCIQAGASYTAKVFPYVKKCRNLLLKWAASSASFHPGQPSENGIPDFQVYVPIRSDSFLSQELAGLASHFGGVHLELDTKAAFQGTAPYLHPWIGVVEGTVEELAEMVRSAIFGVSASSCLALLVYNYDVQLALKSAIDVAGYDIQVRLVSFPLTSPTQDRFQMQAWLDRPVMKLWEDGGNENGILYVAAAATAPPKGAVRQSPAYQLALCNAWPLVLAPSPESIFLLGEDYPLFTQELEPFQLRHFATVGRVQAAILYLEERRHHFPTPKAWLEQLARTRIGTLVRRITRE